MRRLFLGLALCLAITGCASSIKHDPSVSTTAQLVEPQVATVTLIVNDSAKPLVAENTNFSSDELVAAVKKTLAARGLIKPGSGQLLEIELMDVRSRSTLSAVMFGFMAGNDRVGGTVRIRDAAGNVLKKYDVTASYALGGFAGGIQSTRMGWLYEEFAKHSADGLSPPAVTAGAK